MLVGLGFFGASIMPTLLLVAEGSLHITANQQTVQWNFVMVAQRSRPEPNSLFELSRKPREELKTPRL